MLPGTGTTIAARPRRRHTEPFPCAQQTGGDAV